MHFNTADPETSQRGDKAQLWEPTEFAVAWRRIKEGYKAGIVSVTHHFPSKRLPPRQHFLPLKATLSQGHIHCSLAKRRLLCRTPHSIFSEIERQGEHPSSAGQQQGCPRDSKIQFKGSCCLVSARVGRDGTRWLQEVCCMWCSYFISLAGSLPGASL